MAKKRHHTGRLAFLLAARFVTGAVLPVTGGSELWRGQSRI